MADDSTAQLLVKIAATTELLKVQMAAAEQSVGRFEQRTNVSLGKVDGYFARLNAGASKMRAVLAGATAGAVGVLTQKLLALPGALVDVAQRALEFASSLAETAQQIGVTAADLQVYRFAATQVGISQEEMDKGLQKFTKSLGEARTGGKDAAKVFKSLGFTDDDIRHLDVHDALLKTADGIAAIGDRAARSTPETKLFGKAGQQLDTLLSQGAKGVTEFAAAARELGIVLSDKQIQDADNAADKLAAVKAVLEANIAGAVANNANAILQLANALAQVVVWAGKAAQAYSNYQAVQGLKSGDRGTIQNSVNTLISSSSGRQHFRAEVDQRLTQLNDSYNRGKVDTGTTNIGIGTLRQQRDATPAELDHLRARIARLQHIRGNLDKLDAANYSPDSPKIQGGAGDLGGVGGLSATGGGKHRTAAEKIDRFPSDLARAQGDELTARLALAVDAADRAAIERQLLDADHREADARVNESKDLSAAQKARLIAINANVAAAKAEAIDRATQEKQAAEVLTSVLAENAAAQDRARAVADLARTASERRQAELELLKLTLQEKGVRLDAIVRSTSATTSEKADAIREIDRLPEERARETTKIVRGTQSPIEEYRDTVHRSAAQMREDLESVEVEGLRSLNDGITDAIVNGKSLGSVFKAVANQIIADIVRIAVQQAVIAPLFGGSGGLGGLLGSFGSLFGKAPGRATGGPISAGQPYWVGERGPELVVPRLSGNVLNNASMRGAGGAGMRVEIVDTTGLFETRVTQISAPLAARAGQAATLQGADLAGARAAVRSSRQLA